MKTQVVGKTISRLAVVAKDFSTYYIPGITMIGSNQVNQIAEIGDEYHILDVEGNTLSTVQKSAPCVVDWTDVYEGPDPEWLNSDEIQQILVIFGNYLFEEYQVMAKNSKGEDMAIRNVSDADLRNFEDSLFIKN